VLKFEGPSGPNPGAFLGTFVAGGSGGLANPGGILFGPDPSGNGNTDLYVASVQLQNPHLKPVQGTSEVLRYDATTGAFLGTFVTPDSGGLHFPTFLAFTETDPTTLNYDGATPSTALTATTPSTPIQPAAATVTTNTASPLIASSSMSPAPLLASPTPGNSSIDPTALSVTLSLSQFPATPAASVTPALWFAQEPLLVPSLASNLPPAGHGSDSTDPAQTYTPAADQVLASLDGELLVSERSDRIEK
jgi:hypothetical protein